MADEKKNDKPQEEAVFLPSTAQLDLERRYDEENMTPDELAEKYHTEARDFTGDGNDTSAYVGVNPEYMNYANPGEQPFRAGKDSVVGKLEERYLTGAVAESVPVESNQTDGGGSTVPLVYPELSGSDFSSRVVTVDEAQAEAERLAPTEGDKKQVESNSVSTPVAPVKTAASSSKASGNTGK